MESPVFLLVSGARRSGTTAFAHALNSHPQVGILHEYGPDRLVQHVLAFFERWDEQFGADGPVPQLPDGSDAEAAFPLPHRTRDFDRVLLGVFSSVFPDKTLRVIGDKTPTFLNDEGFQRLRHQLPHLKLVYLLRNPIDVVYSSLRRAQLAARGVDVWDIKRVGDACREWLSDCHQLHRVRTESLCETLVLKYEDFTPERAPAQWEKIAAFLGVSNDFTHAVEARVRATQHTMPETWSRYTQYCFEELAKVWHEDDVDSLLEKALRVELPLRNNQVVSFGDGMSGGAYLQDGFAAPEHDGAWTIDRQAQLVFRAITSTETSCLEIDFSSRVSRSRRRMRFIVHVNGEQTGFDASPFSWDEIFRIQINLRQNALKTGDTVHVRFEILDPKERSEEPAGDPRALGLYLRRMKLYGATIVGSVNLGFELGPEGAVYDAADEPAAAVAAESDTARAENQAADDGSVSAAPESELAEVVAASEPIATSESEPDAVDASVSATAPDEQAAEPECDQDVAGAVALTGTSSVQLDGPAAFETEADQEQVEALARS